MINSNDYDNDSNLLLLFLIKVSSKSLCSYLIYLNSRNFKNFQIFFFGILTVIGLIGSTGCNRYESRSPSPYVYPPNSIPPQPGAPPVPGGGTHGPVVPENKKDQKGQKSNSKNTQSGKKSKPKIDEEDDEEIPLGPPGSSKNNLYTYYDFYQLTGEGCDKTRHEFGSMTSKQDVLNQICEALQDDSVNSFRCEEERKSIFYKTCKGRQYIPKNNQTSNPSNQPIQYPDQSNPHQNKVPPNAINIVEEISEDQILTAIESIKFYKYKSTYSLSGSLNLEFTNGLFQDFKDNCFTYRDKDCNSYSGDDSIRSGRNIIKVSNQINWGSGIPPFKKGQIIYFSTAKMKKSQKIIALVYLLHEIEPIVSINQVYVFQIKSEIKGRSLDEFVLNQTTLTPLVHILVNTQ